MTTKYDLPSTYVGEMVEYNRLYLLGASRTSTGNPTFTSSSSSTTYTVSDNTGENGMLVLLQTALASYIITASDWNGIVDLIVTTATANKLLKLDSNAKLPASITGDADTLDTKHASDFLGSTKVTGNVTYTDSISAGTTLTKNIAIGSDKKIGKALFRYSTSNTRAALVFFDTSSTGAFATGYCNYATSGASWSRNDLGYVITGDFGYLATGNSCIRVNDVYISGTNLVIVFANTDSSSQSLSCTIYWEAY